MTDAPSEEELDAIERWGAGVLESYNRGGSVLANRLCDYTGSLPTHSIRSQLLALVAALRSERTQTRDLLHRLEIEEGTSAMLATDRDDALNEAEALRAELAVKDARVAELQHWIGASM